MASVHVKVGILTVSDRCSRGEAEDKSGPNLQKLVKSSKLNVSEVQCDCVPDERNAIKRVLLKWCDLEELHLVLTTGGTGFSPRDVTPEVTSEVIEKSAPGLSLAMLSESLKFTPMAMLSRATCGIRKKTVIINLPGSLKGSQECLQFVLPALPHAIEVLRDSPNVGVTHASMQGSAYSPVSTLHTCPHKAHSKAIRDLSRVAERDRHSPYPLIPMDEAISMIIANSECLPQKVITLEESLGFILASDVFAKEPFPPFPASVKDGYAVLASDGPGERLVLGPVTPGEVTACNVISGHVMRITTGAPLPPGADAVVQVEDTELLESDNEGRTEKRIKILTTPKPGKDIRPVGFDLSKGQKVLTALQKLGPAELGLMASLGLTEIEVFQKPKEDIEEKTTALWSWLNVVTMSNPDRFKNMRYNKNQQQKVLYPQYRIPYLKLWSSHYVNQYRYDHVHDASKAAELQALKLEEVYKDLLDKYSRLLQRLAAVDSEDCSSKMSFYTATLHRALQKKSSNDHLGVFNGHSNSSLDHALDESGTWSSLASNLSEEDPSCMKSMPPPSRRMTRSRSLDDMLDIDSRHRRVLKKTTGLKRRVGSSKFYTEQIQNPINKESSSDVRNRPISEKYSSLKDYLDSTLTDIDYESEKDISVSEYKCCGYMVKQGQREFKKALRDTLMRAAWYELLSTMAN